MLMDLKAVKDMVDGGKPGACKHTFIVTNVKNGVKGRSASQIMCQHCLRLATFEDVAKANEGDGEA